MSLRPLFSTDYIHNELERPKQLSNFDLCLQHTDCAWHSPLWSGYLLTRPETNGHVQQHQALKGPRDIKRRRAKVNPTNPHQADITARDLTIKMMTDIPVHIKVNTADSGKVGTVIVVDILLRFCNLSNIPVC